MTYNDQLVPSYSIAPCKEKLCLVTVAHSVMAKTDYCLFRVIMLSLNVRDLTVRSVPHYTAIAQIPSVVVPQRCIGILLCCCAQLQRPSLRLPLPTWCHSLTRSNACAAVLDQMRALQSSRCTSSPSFEAHTALWSQ